jgi:hypothetical protein
MVPERPCIRAARHESAGCHSWFDKRTSTGIKHLVAWPVWVKAWWRCVQRFLGLLGGVSCLS